MFQSSILRILPILTLAISLTAAAKETSSLLPMTVGKTYTGKLTPSPTNPAGEVCYQLTAQPDTRITLNIKTAGVGIVKFAVYDQTKALRFFHNDVNHQPQNHPNNRVESKFSFPTVSDASQVCLTTTNPHQGQEYDFTVTSNNRQPTKPQLKLRPIVIAELPAPPPIVQQRLAATPAEIPPAPNAEPYCYVGTWQIADLSGYWLPFLQNFTQAKITDPQMIGYAKLTLNKDGNAYFEALDLEQKYTLKVKETGAIIDRLELSIGGNARAKFQTDPGNILTFNSQNYQRLTSKIDLGSGLKLTGDRLFTLFGDRDTPATKLPYKCLDRDNLILKVPTPTGQKLVPISLKRIS